MYDAREGFQVKNRRKSRRFSGPAARGRRIRRMDVPGSGRYVKSRLPGAVLGPIAIDATLRAAAPHQPGRRLLKLAPADGVRILPQDFREKVLSRLTGASVLFTVDASGSMGSETVMGHAKGIVLTLLNDVYQKRDRVGMIAFRGTEARLALPFSTSVELAHRRLRSLPTGGKSPLALALAKSIEVLETEIKRNPGRTPLLVVLTDARANISMGGTGKNPFDEALEQARRIRDKKLRALVVDTDLTWIDSFPYARVLAEAMGAKCLRLANLQAGRVIEFITG